MIAQVYRHYPSVIEGLAIMDEMYEDTASWQSAKDLVESYTVGTESHTVPRLGLGGTTGTSSKLDTYCFLKRSGGA